MQHSPPTKNQSAATKSAAEQGGFLVPASRPRIGSTDWLQQRDNAIAVFNSRYDVDGTRLDIGDVEPWTVITPAGEWHHFWTHTEALTWALQEARK